MTTILRYITDVGKIFTAFIYYFKKALEKKEILFKVGVSQGAFDAQVVDKIFDFIKCFSI